MMAGTLSRGCSNTSDHLTVLKLGMHSSLIQKVHERQILLTRYLLENLSMQLRSFGKYLVLTHQL